MKHFKKIIYIHERDAQLAAGFARVLSLAANNQAQLCVATVAPDIRHGYAPPLASPSGAAMQAQVIAEAKRDLQQMLAQTSPRAHPELRVLVGDGPIQIIRTVLREGFDLVIKQAEDPSWISRLFGAEDMQLLRQCPCPVWLMRERERDNYRCIAAAIDFDPHQPETAWQGLNQKILDLASSLALSDFASLHLLHSWEPHQTGLLPPWEPNDEHSLFDQVAQEQLQQEVMQQTLDWLRQRLGEEAYTYLKPQAHLLQGSPKQLIPAQIVTLQADLLVMGSLARTGIAGLFIGNTAETILEQIQCGALTVKPKGFVSPVTLEH